MNTFKVRLSVIFITACALAIMAVLFLPSHSGHETSSASTSAPPSGAPLGSYELAQQVFDHRCVECHSCNNAPCQLKLTSYEGLNRGLSKQQVYDTSRLAEAQPTRLGIDAHGEAAWRAMGFAPVVIPGHSVHETPLMQVLKTEITGVPTKHVKDQNECPLNPTDLQSYLQANTSNLMPYGLPPLSNPERNALIAWINAGSHPPTTTVPPAADDEERTRGNWEAFLNRPDIPSRLVARYLFEHLFLAHVSFDAHSMAFHRLIRSRSACGPKLSEIATRRPTDDPGGAFNYCFQRITETIVEKTHLTYLMDQNKFWRLKQIFFGTPWSAASWPGYTNGANPFETFASIPVKTRYQFLLEDSEYHVATFIKGPVCNGSTAVNAIDEQFNVFFIDPNSELQVRDPGFARASPPKLVLPAEIGSRLNVLLIAPSIAKYLQYEGLYKAEKQKVRARLFPKGYSLADIWNGDGHNPNAALTVFRNFDNSYVTKGIQGGMPSTAFILDYSLFERLVYNLAVGYDVFGAISHQLYTREYMGLIRREAEDNFLSFLPAPSREALYKQWEGWLPQIQEQIVNFPPDLSFPSQIAYDGSESVERQLIQKIANERLNSEILGSRDYINTRSLTIQDAKADPTLASQPGLDQLRQISQVPQSAAPYVGYMPDSSLLIVTNEDQIKRIYTIIRNKAHSSVGIMLLENQSRDPAHDNLVIVPGLFTSFPNFFYVVSDASIGSFASSLQSVRSSDEYARFNERWGMDRSDGAFWNLSDRLHSYLRSANPTEFGYLDYTRYGMWSDPAPDHGK